MMIKLIILFGYFLSTIVSSQFISNHPHGGFVGHRLATSGGFMGNSGLISGGGFVGHQQQIVPSFTSNGDFVGHDHHSTYGSIPSSGIFYSSVPMSFDGTQYIPTTTSSISPFHGSSIHLTSEPIYHYPSFRFRRSIDGLPTHDRSPTVYYGIDGQKPNDNVSSKKYTPPKVYTKYTKNSNSDADDTDDQTPKPYQFSLQTQDNDGTGGATWQQQEESTPDGVIVGSYTIQDPLTGSTRIVNYRADNDGFHAEIQSNEFSVVDSDPANASYRTIPPSSSSSGYHYQSQQQQQQQQQQRKQFFKQPQQQQQQQQYAKPVVPKY